MATCKQLSDSLSPWFYAQSETSILWKLMILNLYVVFKVVDSLKDSLMHYYGFPNVFLESVGLQGSSGIHRVDCI